MQPEPVGHVVTGDDPLSPGPSLRRCTRPATPQLAELLREALTNAVVHGAATRATVTITGTADGISVCVADNGIGPQHGPPGLGSALLDEATGQGLDARGRP